MTGFAPYLSAPLGGAYIGLAGVWLLWATDQFAETGRNLEGLLGFEKTEFAWRTLLLLGLGGSPWIYNNVMSQPIQIYDATLVGTATVACLLVGIGTQIYDGFEREHDDRKFFDLSIRSVCATATFILAGGVALYGFRHICRLSP